MDTSELRVHGVSGTPPRDILYTDPVPVGRTADGLVDLQVYEKPSRDQGFDVGAFHWGGLTARSRWTALWIVLGPFALANAAGWMSTNFGRRARTFVRLSGLGLTALFADQAAKAAVYLPDRKLVELGSGGRGPAVAALTAVTAFGLVLMVALLSLQSHFVESEKASGDGSARAVVRSLIARLADKLRLLFGTDPSTLVRVPDAGATQPDRSGGGWSDPAASAHVLGDDMWSLQPILQRLIRVHLAMALAVVALDLASWTAAGWTWWLAGAIAAAAVGAIALLTVVPNRLAVVRLTMFLPHAAVGALAVTVVAAALSGPRQEPSIHSVTLGLVAAIGVSIILAGVYAGVRVMGVLVLAAQFGAILGIVVGLIAEGLLGIEPVLVPNGAGWAAVAMLFLLGSLLAAAFVAMATGRVDPGTGEEMALSSADGKGRRRGSRRAQFLLRRVSMRASGLATVSAAFGASVGALVLGRLLLHWVDTAFVFDPAVLGTPGNSRIVLWAAVGLGLMLAASTAVFVGVCWGWKAVAAFVLAAGVVVALAGAGRLSVDFLGIEGRTDEGIVELAVLLSVLVPGSFLLRSVLAGLRPGQESGDRRRKVGILWDITTFWPRWYQPLGPPAYGPLVVAGLTDRLRLERPTVLGAHSQGSLIAAIVLARMPAPERSRIFLSYGSQLGVLYPDMFPNVGLGDVRKRLAYEMPGRWMNLWRRTDPIGGQYVSELGPDNLEVIESVGHSGYEVTAMYSEARAAALSTPVVVVDLRDDAVVRRDA